MRSSLLNSGSFFGTNQCKHPSSKCLYFYVLMYIFWNIKKVNKTIYPTTEVQGTQEQLGEGTGG